MFLKATNTKSRAGKRKVANIKRMKAKKTEGFGKSSVHQGNDRQKEEGKREKWCSLSKRKLENLLNSLKNNMKGKASMDTYHNPLVMRG